jgi:hypothetical protein
MSSTVHTGLLGAVVRKIPEYPKPNVPCANPFSGTRERVPGVLPEDCIFDDPETTRGVDRDMLDKSVYVYGDTNDLPELEKATLKRIDKLLEIRETATEERHEFLTNAIWHICYTNLEYPNLWHYREKEWNYNGDNISDMSNLQRRASAFYGYPADRIDKQRLN